MFNLKMRIVLLLSKRLALICLVMTGLCQAQNLPNSHFRVVDISQIVEFKSDQEMVLTTRMEREALTAEGAQELTKHVYGFNGALEDSELIEAYTLKKTGQKIPLGKESFTKQLGQVSSGIGATTPEWEVHQIAFPSLTVGDKTVIHTRKTVKRAPMLGWLSYSDYLWPATAIEKATWRIVAPAAMRLTLRKTVSGNAEPKIQNGLQIWEFEDSTKAKALIRIPQTLGHLSPILL
jgi:hypothetical protein